MKSGFEHVLFTNVRQRRHSCWREVETLVVGLLRLVRRRANAQRAGETTIHDAMTIDQWYSLGLTAPPYNDGRTLFTLRLHGQVFS